MLAMRKADSRGHVNHGWLDSYHTFSFGSYYNPQEMGFSNLRVINDDTVAPGGGFAEHGHEGQALGVSWDGTGYGPDGTVWGGEFLVGNAAEFRRAGRSVRTINRETKYSSPTA